MQTLEISEMVSFLYFRSSKSSARFNGFFLSMCSPVLQKTICCGFSESTERRLNLEDVDPQLFTKILDVWSGKDILEVTDMDYALRLAALADRFHIAEISAELDHFIAERLNADTCADALMTSAAMCLHRVEDAARRMALEHFQEVADSPGFLRLEEDALAALLDDDALAPRSEEAVLEAAARWMRAGPAPLRGGAALLRRVRFGLMDPDFLAGPRARGLFPPGCGDVITPFLEEALRAKTAAGDGGGDGGGGADDSAAAKQYRWLGPKAFARRGGAGVRWERYTGADTDTGGGGGGGGGCEAPVRVDGHVLSVTALAAGDGRVFAGAWDGTVTVRRRARGLGGWGLKCSLDISYAQSVRAAGLPNRAAVISRQMCK
jgi:hypothetical protein